MRVEIVTPWQPVPVMVGTKSPRIYITAEDSLSAAERLVREGKKPVVLNFASGRNPGGGYKRGTVGQEEDLCRTTHLASRLESPEAAPFYRYHAQAGSSLFSDYCIYTPDVGVGGALWTCAFLTCAAPNIGRITHEEWDEVRTVLKKRALRILSVAAQFEHPAIVLGAWGCGHFRNDPPAVAQAFHDALDQLGGCFDEVVFPIPGPDSTRRVFQEEFHG